MGKPRTKRIAVLLAVSALLAAYFSRGEIYRFLTPEVPIAKTETRYIDKTRYTRTVPVSAVVEEQGRYYVYIAAKHEDYFFTHHTAQKKEIGIMGRDAANCAVEFFDPSIDSLNQVYVVTGGHAKLSDNIDILPKN